MAFNGHTCYLQFMFAESIDDFDVKTPTAEIILSRFVRILYHLKFNHPFMF